MWILNQKKTTFINTDKLISIWIEQATFSIKCRYGSEKEAVYTLSTHKNMDETIDAFNNLIANIALKEK